STRSASSLRTVLRIVLICHAAGFLESRGRCASWNCIVPRDWPQEEREGWMGDPKGHLERMRIYDIARHPDRISAPPPWPVEIALLGAGALICAGQYDDSMSLRAWRQAMWRAPLWELYGKARRRAAVRRARRLGLTPATAPEQRIPSRMGASLLFVLAWLVLRRRREPPRSDDLDLPAQRVGRHE